MTTNNSPQDLSVIITHENTDFDALAALVAAHKLYPHALPIIPSRMSLSVRNFFTLYQSALPLVYHKTIEKRRVGQIILVDTYKIPDTYVLRQMNAPTLIFDHHQHDEPLPAHFTYQHEAVGAITTYFVEQIRQRHLPITSLEATLMALGIYADTGSLTYPTTTTRDILAAAWLLEQNAVLDTVRKFMTLPLDRDQQRLYDRLLESVEYRTIHGYNILMCHAELEKRLDQINMVVHRLHNALESDATCAVLVIKNYTQLIFRSRTDSINVSLLAQQFSGGGHPRAAAGHYRTVQPIPQITEKLWEWMAANVQPLARVSDLMSYGAQTVHPYDRLADIIPNLRKIGHEGYPVIDDQRRVVGLLTRRDADRALEHDLRDTRVRDIMSSGEITLTPEDTIATFERLIVETGWGQIPVVDGQRQLMGIVTRTDLIKHWAKQHPSRYPAENRIEPAQIAEILGDPVARLIALIAQQAQQRHDNLYMVGGVVRDLLLRRPNFDIDFVLESDAIAFTAAISAAFGGTVNSFRPFGTAKWRLDEHVAAHLGVDLAALPDHIDFTTSRNEFYNHPTALPSVYNSSIKLDLHRRDFTINAMAVQLSPEIVSGRLLDFYGGLDDLRNGVLRVLHSLSFIDDPTRILRAIRFEQRLAFEIDPRALELIANARPMLRRITGERLRNELQLLLEEHFPERGLLALDQRDLLTAIHPSLHFDPTATEFFERARQADWPLPPESLPAIYWHLWMAQLAPEEIPDIGARLLISHQHSAAWSETARLWQEAHFWESPRLPSQITERLMPVSETGLLAVWVMSAEIIQEQISEFLLKWRYVKPFTTGRTLQALGLMPGPRYKALLARLRVAWLDGEIDNEASEASYLQRLIETLPDGDI